MAQHDDENRDDPKDAGEEDPEVRDVMNIRIPSIDEILARKELLLEKHPWLVDEMPDIHNRMKDNVLINALMVYIGQHVLLYGPQIMQQYVMLPNIYHFAVYAEMESRVMQRDVFLATEKITEMMAEVKKLLDGTMEKVNER